jgi:hypothetical protein
MVTKSKRGRPLKGERPMTAAERKRNSRAKKKASVTPKPKRTPRQLSPEQHQRLMRMEATEAFERAKAIAQAEAKKAEPSVPAKPLDPNRCPSCGRLYALVGRSHLCTPTEIT